MPKSLDAEKVPRSAATSQGPLWVMVKVLITVWRIYPAATSA